MHGLYAAMAAKTDNERLGFFSEMSYVSKGDHYKSKSNAPFNAVAYKGKQMMTSHAKSRTAQRDGYFHDFTRVMAGEGLSDPVKTRRKELLKEKKKMVSGPFAYTGDIKPIASAGSYDSCFSGKVESFSPKTKPGPKYVQPKRNFTTFPGKKGTGYGYTHVTIGKLPEYKSSPYDAARAKEVKEAKAARGKVVGAPFKSNNPDSMRLFDKNPMRSAPLGKAKKIAPAKKITVPFAPPRNPGTMQSGGNTKTLFTKFEYTGEKPRPRKKVPEIKGPKFKPISNIKGKPTTSISTTNINRSMNSSNFASISCL